MLWLGLRVNNFVNKFSLKKRGIPLICATCVFVIQTNQSCSNRKSARIF
jgi:hypothetical protein